MRLISNPNLHCCILLLQRLRKCQKLGLFPYAGQIAFVVPLDSPVQDCKAADLLPKHQNDAFHLAFFVPTIHRTGLYIATGTANTWAVCIFTDITHKKTL